MIMKMTKEQRTSLNILIDLAIRKGIDFELEHRLEWITFSKNFNTHTTYSFSGVFYREEDFKKTQEILKLL